ncbi:uncharacterized protein [Nicotiana sylvestris]|uniref:uncharacterized protein n=1 Tax=Nicotiana sylvestris TaxID=4096 RepID=UPI00388C5F30
MGDEKEEKIDHTHPLFVHPSDTPGSILIPVKLTGSENYGLWRRTMQIALQAKRELGFVTGTCTKDQFKAKLHEDWEICNAIRDCLCIEHREIATISQGTDSVAAYFTKLKELWAEYDALVPSPGSDCPKSRDYIEHLHRQRLLQFLSGLNESYEQARRHILIKTVEPTLNQAYAMIIEDKSQRSNLFPALTGKADPMAMQVGRGQPYRGKKPFMQCDYCNMKGHLKENCYKLNGYPSDFKGKKKYAANSVTRNAELDKRSEGMEGGNSSEPPKFGSYFTEDQYKQILGILNKETTNPQANMTDITTCLMADVCYGEWIIDSCASHHITADLNMLRTHTKLDSCNKDQVNLPNGEKAKITHMGIADFLDKIQVDQDLYNGRVREIGREEGDLYIVK